MPTKKTDSTLSDVELAAMKDAVRERKAAKSGKVDGPADLLAKIAEMEEPDRSMAARIHELVIAAAPHLQPKTWYGMPAWAKDGKVICFFQSASKFKVRYATFGFQPDAALDDGSFWPTGWALTELTPRVEAEITDLVRRAAG
ncbi:MAG TPA: DUF1801 domain-containing protein [Candidatus Limnocylindrales bacterium]|nr:DUF1801 domain-containing protein [Candidatus Limnocylindrales bacterium]